MSNKNSHLFNTSIESINPDDDSNFLDTSNISIPYDNSISNDNINVTINIVNDSGATVGHLSGSMHLSDLNISDPNLLNNTTLPDDSFTGSDNSFSFNFNYSLNGNLTTSMHLSELEGLDATLNISARTDNEISDTSIGGKRIRKKRTVKKKRSRRNKKRSRSRR